MQSCGILYLRGNYANLSNKSPYQAVDLQLSMPLYKTNVDFYVGYAKTEFITESDYTLKIDKIAPTLGIGLNYYFTKTRFQPLTSIELNYLSDTSDKWGYTHLTPKVGFRYYLTEKISLNTGVGYQIGLLKIKGEKEMLQGAAASIGIGYNLINF